MHNSFVVFKMYPYGNNNTVLQHCQHNILITRKTEMKIQFWKNPNILNVISLFFYVFIVIL